MKHICIHQQASQNEQMNESRHMKTGLLVWIMRVFEWSVSGCLGDVWDASRLSAQTREFCLLFRYQSNPSTRRLLAFAQADHMQQLSRSEHEVAVLGRQRPSVIWEFIYSGRLKGRYFTGSVIRYKAYLIRRSVFLLVKAMYINMYSVRFTLIQLLYWKKKDLEMLNNMWNCLTPTHSHLCPHSYEPLKGNVLVTSYNSCQCERFLCWFRSFLHLFTLTTVALG